MIERHRRNSEGLKKILGPFQSGSVGKSELADRSSIAL